MPRVFPFHALQYAEAFAGGDVGSKIAPPYDVLDERAKSALLSRDPHNIVAVDLPHVPPKNAGPAEVYEAAAKRLGQWITGGVLKRREHPVLMAYRQTFDFLGKRFERCGVACAIETFPFGARAGGGVLPHEQTFSGPKEDRFRLMRATACQLSPIFGLHADESGEASGLVRRIMSAHKPDVSTMLGSVREELWTIEDEHTIGQYEDALEGEDVFIADGHHRYTTAINYLADLEARGPVAADHPARRTMIVLVSMSDPGLAIGPTHRVLGGMRDYSLDAFLKASAGTLRTEPVAGDIHALHKALHSAASAVENRLGLYDFASGRGMIATPTQPDPLAKRFASRCEAWRKLDVAIVQHLVVEEICVAKLNAGQDVKWAFPHSVDEVLEIGSGVETGSGGGRGFAQLAVLVRPTPLQAVRDVSKAGELMPQKSTFFYPKLATGLFLHPLA